MTPENPFDLEIETGWGDEPEDAEPDLDWLHVYPGHSGDVVVLSETPLRYMGHFDPQHKRMRHCDRPKTCPSWQPGTPCPWERLGRPRARFILVVLYQGRQWLWEFGEVQRDQIKPLAAAHGGLAGLPLALLRPAGRNKPPLIVRAGDEAAEQAARGALPECVDPTAFLWGTWLRQKIKAGKGGVSSAPPPSASVDAHRPPRSGSSPASPSGEQAERWRRQDEAYDRRMRALHGAPAGEQGERKYETETEPESEQEHDPGAAGEA